jgi:hypothetical protein
MTHIELKLRRFLQNLKKAIAEKPNHYTLTKVQEKSLAVLGVAQTEEWFMLRHIFFDTNKKAYLIRK